MEAIITHAGEAEDARESLVGQQPRRYQTEAARSLPARLAEHGRVLVVGPTGCGKTQIAIGDNESWRRVLFVVHRYELLSFQSTGREDAKTYSMGSASPGGVFR